MEFVYKSVKVIATVFVVIFILYLVFIIFILGSIKNMGSEKETLLSDYDTRVRYNAQFSQVGREPRSVTKGVELNHKEPNHSNRITADLTTIALAEKLYDGN